MCALTLTKHRPTLKRLQYNFVRFFSDSYGYTRLLEHCTTPRMLQQIHAQTILTGYEQNQFLAAKLISKYVEHIFANMDHARRVFDRVLQRDILLWNVMIRGYANLGPFDEAMSIYDQMRLSGVCANKYTYPFLLKACAAVGVKIKGQIIHGHLVKAGLEFDLFVGNSLVAFYAKCRDVQVSRKVFDEILVKDIVSWNSMLAGYTQNECSTEALVLLHEMLQYGKHCVPDNATLVGILPACAQEAAIKEGSWIHCYVIKYGMKVDVALGSGLIAMYGSCGHLNIARDIFIRMRERNIMVWNAMIRCFGMNGHANDALDLFSEMIRCGVHPDGIIFVSVLSACGHAGLVDKGLELFEKMRDYGVERREEHYACMVDLLGRAGKLDEAVKLTKSMPMKGGKGVYGALLGACRIHNNLELAEEVAERLFILDPHNAGRYILLAKMYEDVGKWNEAARLRKAMRENLIKKQLGFSAIEVDSVLHTFGVEDESHPHKEPIFDTLQNLELLIEEGLLD